MRQVQLGDTSICSVPLYSDLGGGSKHQWRGGRSVIWKPGLTERPLRGWVPWLVHGGHRSKPPGGVTGWFWTHVCPLFSPNCDMLPSGKLWNRVVAKQFNHRAASLPSFLPPHHQINEQQWALQRKPRTLQCFHSYGWRLQNQFRITLLLDQCLFLFYLWKKTWISKEDNLTFQGR